MPEPITPGPPHDIAHPVMLQGWHDLTALHWRYEPAEVSHAPWPIHAAELLEYDESLIEAAGLGPPRGEPIVRWSPGVEVRIAIPRSIRRSNLR